MPSTDSSEVLAQVAQEKPVMMAPFGSSADPILAFPETSRSNSLPFVLFTAMGAESSPAISLPIPLGLTVGDGMSYSTINLDPLKSIMAETLTQMGKQDTVSGVIGAGLGGMIGSTVSKIKQLNVAAGLAIAARMKNLDNVADVIDFSQRQVIAPNSNTTFQNSNIRTYSFSFKMVSRSKKEAATIDKIVKVFRKFMYPEGRDVILTYPPMWDIQFYDKDGTINSYLPKIYSSYLTNLSASYNATTNIFHQDGSPVETDIAISFQESKALTRGDIEKLEKGGRGKSQKE